MSNKDKMMHASVANFKWNVPNSELSEH